MFTKDPTHFDASRPRSPLVASFASGGFPLVTHVHYLNKINFPDLNLGNKTLTTTNTWFCFGKYSGLD